ncbi:MAG: response regulator [Planctomycetota bacterium]|nr:response regulator [Planctomycetota bacterium]
MYRDDTTAESTIAPFPPRAIRRVLVADDEALVAAGLVAALGRMGIEAVGPVGDGQTALALAHEAAPDVAILDIRMPVMDGLDCARRLWAELAIPTVIVSAYSDPGSVERAERGGAFGYLLKPVSVDSLRAALAVGWSRAGEHIAHLRRIDQLEATLAARRTVELAKWKIIQARGVEEPDAHALLQRAARSGRRRLADIAADVLNDPSHPLLFPEGDDGHHAAT